MDLSVSDSTAKTVRANICKIALRTIPRCGIAAFILLSMGLYFLFPACQTFQQIQADKNSPYELTATTDNSNIDLNSLMQIEGVKRISPVVKLNATLSLEEYTLNYEIRAVYSNYLGLNFTHGTIYPDSSNMPYLILNKDAAKAFSHKYQTVSVSPNDTVMISVNGTDRKAIICGIFDDRSDTPAIYMSYEVAQKLYGTSGQTTLIFFLSNKGLIEDVVSALQRQNIHTVLDPNITLAWDLLQQQCWQSLILCIGLMSSSLVVLREKRIAELVKSSSEMNMLHLSGMTHQNLKMVYPIRILMMAMLCLFLALAISCFSGSFSMQALQCSLFCIIGMSLLVVI